MAFLMSDVAAGSNAALQLQRNMAAAPDVQQMQTNVMQEQVNTLQQQEQNVEKTKLANLVADAGIKSDANIKSKIQALVQGEDYTKADSASQALQLARLYGEAGKAEDSVKLMQVSETITNKDLVNQSKKLDIERQSIVDANGVLELLPLDKLNEGFNNLPEATRNLIINRAGPENWKNFSPKEKKAVVQNLFETATAKLQEQKFANNLALAQIRSNERLLAQTQRDNHSERVRNSTRDENTKMWGVVTSALDRVQRDPATIKERERLDEEVGKTETAATKSTTLGGLTSYSPEGSNKQFYSEDSFNKYMQAIRKRDKHIAAQLDEEEAIVKTLPAAAGTLRQSQLDKIEKQRGTLQLEEPGAKKKVETAPATTTPAKPDVTSSKIPEIRPLSLNPDGSSARTGLGWPPKDTLLKANDAIMNGADVEAVTKRMRDAGYDITTKDLTPEYIEYAKKQKK